MPEDANLALLHTQRVWVATGCFPPATGADSLRAETIGMAQTASQKAPHVHGPGCNHDHDHNHDHHHNQTYVRSQPKIGRNDPCPCGSGKKYKKCCGLNL